MIFSLAGHNREHFLVEDPLWDEALFENVDAQNTKNILTNNREMQYKMSEEYTLQNFILKRGKRKKNNVRSLSSLKCSICITDCRRTISTSDPILIICKSR